MFKHFNITVSGKVQGVFFRASALKEAEKHRISGFVRNEPNGDVYLEVEGERGNLAHFMEWCSAGPSGAVVNRIWVDEAALADLKGFEIRK